MKLLKFLFASSIMGLVYFVAKSNINTGKKQEELLRSLVIRSLAALKSSSLAMEKSASSYLREIAEKAHEDIAGELGQIIEENTESNLYKELLMRAKKFQMDYEYNEDFPFDISYTEHQLRECDKILDTANKFLRLSTTDNQSTTDNPSNTDNQTDPSAQDLALKYQTIFSRYQSALNSFYENFLAVDEHRIRDFAHQIWESEGRPEGQAARHWAMAVELSKHLTSAELQLAFEQKRSAVDLLSTTRFDHNLSSKERIH